MTEKRKHEMYLWGGVIGGGAILFFVFVPHTSGYAQTGGRNSNRNSSPQRQPLSSHPSTMPNPQQASVDEAFLAARTQALSMFDQTILGEKAVQDQLIATNNETAAQKAISFNQDATSLKMAGIESTTAIDVAGTQASAAENIASQQASAIGQAEHAQQQQSFWGGIMGFFSQAIGLLGFSQTSALNSPFLNPVSYGSAEVNYQDPFSGLVNPQPDQYNLPSLPTVNYGG